MTKSAAKVAVRRAVLEAQTQRRRARREREDRISGLAVEVSVTLASGQAALTAGRAALAQAEITAGHAVEEMIAMGLSVAEVVDWCAADITPRIVARLRKVAADSDLKTTSEETDASPAALPVASPDDTELDDPGQ